MAAPLFGLNTLSGSPVTTFLGLADVPVTYTGQALKGVRVNAGETGLEFAAIVSTFVSLTDGPGSFTGNALKYVRVNAGETALEYQTFPTLVTAFTQLSDVPSSYSGQANKVLACNPGETGLTFLSTTLSDLQLVLAPTTRFAIFAGGGWGSGTAVSGFGASFAANTLTNPALATTNLLTSTYRAVATGSAVAGNSANIRCSEAIVWRGNASGLGGFKVRCRFASETALAQQRGFVGLCATIGTTIPDGQPSAFVNVCGFSYDSAATNWSTITNDNVGAATTSSLGASYPVDATTLYEMTLTATPNASSIAWTITNLSTGATTNGTFSSNLPVNTTFLTFQLWINNGTTASAAKATCVFAVVSLYG